MGDEVVEDVSSLGPHGDVRQSRESVEQLMQLHPGAV